MKKYFTPSDMEWLDTDGNQIAAHGGGVMLHEGVWYWYGEARLNFREFPGIYCYSSRDLMNWQFRGVVLHPVDDESHDLYKSKIVERPKVIYNDRTGKFVMWMHIENNDYSLAHSGVAVSDSPTGPFSYIESCRPNGCDARDMTLFKDDDGTAYLVHATDSNATTAIHRLSDDYLSVTNDFKLVFAGRFREGASIFKRGGKYYCISSGTTGFSPNAGEYAVADSIFGKWRIKGSPFKGPGAHHTFHGQSAFAFNAGNTTVLMCDHWFQDDIKKSFYTWYPVDIDEEKSELSVHFYKKWNFDERIGEDGYIDSYCHGEIELSPENGRSPEPDIVLKSENRSALVWADWSADDINVRAMVFSHLGDSLDMGERLIDIYLGGRDVCVTKDGLTREMIDTGNGCFDRTHQRTDTIEHYSLTSSLVRGQKSEYAAKLGIPADTEGDLYTVRIQNDFVHEEPFERGEKLAFGVILRLDRTKLGQIDLVGAGTTGVSFASFVSYPEKIRQLDTDSHARATLA